MSLHLPSSEEVCAIQCVCERVYENVGTCVSVCERVLGCLLPDSLSLSLTYTRTHARTCSACSPEAGPAVNRFRGHLFSFTVLAVRLHAGNVHAVLCTSPCSGHGKLPASKTLLGKACTMPSQESWQKMGAQVWGMSPGKIQAWWAGSSFPRGQQGSAPTGNNH